LAEKIFSLEIKSDPDLLPEVEAFMVDVAKEVGLSEDKYNNLALSVSEAVSNSMVHGNKEDKSKKINIDITSNGSTLKIIIKDEGKGFDLKKVPDPTEPENILKDSGRGIHIMRSFLDDLEYNFTDSGTETILTIKLN
jgi:serine/threonine-protein kinase RsbW